MSYVMRHGRWIETVPVSTAVPPKRRRKPPAEAAWVKLPRHWISALGQSQSASTYRLALLILLKDFRQKQRKWKKTWRWIVLSRANTGGMSRATKARAARELVELGLVRLKQEGKQAIRVSLL